jgi:hypothetical protein
MRSLNEPCGEKATEGCDGGASICGIAGTSILGGGGGAGSGGLSGEVPGAMNCAEAVPAISAHITAPRMMDDSFMDRHVVVHGEKRKKIAS